MTERSLPLPPCRFFARTRILFWLAIGFGIVMLWCAGLLIYGNRISDAAVIDPSKRYDAIIVLTGGKGRIPQALTWLKEHKTETLFISGVGEGFHVKHPDANAFKTRYPNAQIEYGTKARSTIGNALETLAWLRQTHHQTLLIVTANYHMPRTQLLFDHYLGDYTLHYATIDPPMFDASAWITHPNSLSLVISEYHKWLASWIHITFIG